MKAIIVAMGKNREIGQAGDMPWGYGLKADLARFKQLTRGNTVVMGRRTFESIGKPLPDRQNIVLTQTPTGVQGVISALNLRAAYALAQYDVFICGGARAYEEALADVDILYITEVQAEFPDADTFFPEINENEWREVSREHHEADEKNSYAFDFVTYERI